MKKIILLSLMLLGIVFTALTQSLFTPVEVTAIGWGSTWDVVTGDVLNDPCIVMSRTGGQYADPTAPYGVSTVPIKAVVKNSSGVTVLDTILAKQDHNWFRLTPGAYSGTAYHKNTSGAWVADNNFTATVPSAPVSSTLTAIVGAVVGAVAGALGMRKKKSKIHFQMAMGKTSVESVLQWIRTIVQILIIPIAIWSFNTYKSFVILQLQYQTLESKVDRIERDGFVALSNEKADRIKADDDLNDDLKEFKKECREDNAN